jgi:hypothetical protein
MLRYNVKNYIRDIRTSNATQMRVAWFVPNATTGHVPVLAQAFRVPDGANREAWMVLDPAINYRTTILRTREEAFAEARERQQRAIVDACHALADIDALDRATE